MTWVVETGRPARLAARTSEPVARLADRPCPVDIAVTLWLIVSATRRAPTMPPIAIAAATATRLAWGPSSGLASRTAAIFGVSFEPAREADHAGAEEVPDVHEALAGDAEHAPGVAALALGLVGDLQPQRRRRRRLQRHRAAARAPTAAGVSTTHTQESSARVRPRARRRPFSAA